MVALDVAATAHRGVLLGDRDELEPDALDLKRARLHFRFERGDVGLAVQDVLKLRLVPARDVEQRVKQDVERRLGRSAGDDGRLG